MIDFEIFIILYGLAIIVDFVFIEYVLGEE